MGAGIFTPFLDEQTEAQRKGLVPGHTSRVPRFQPMVSCSEPLSWRRAEPGCLPAPVHGLPCPLCDPRSEQPQAGRADSGCSLPPARVPLEALGIKLPRTGVPTSREGWWPRNSRAPGLSAVTRVSQSSVPRSPGMLTPTHGAAGRLPQCGRTPPGKQVGRAEDSGAPPGLCALWLILTGHRGGQLIANPPHSPGKAGHGPTMAQQVPQGRHQGLVNSAWLQWQLRGGKLGPRH